VSTLSPPGLEYLHRMTEQSPYVLRVTMTDEHGIKAEANYDSIRVDSEADNYKLHLGRWLPCRSLVVGGVQQGMLCYAYRSESRWG